MTYRCPVCGGMINYGKSGVCDLLRDLLDKSYQLVLGSLSKKKQREILAGEECF